MKKTILIMTFLVASIFCTNLMAQFTAGTPYAVLPKKECEVKLNDEHISITGNNQKDYVLVKRNSGFNSVNFSVEKTGGKAKATFTVIVNGVQNRQWTFENNIPSGSQSFTLNNLTNSEVILRVKNHSATNKISARASSKVLTNSLLRKYGTPVLKSNETITIKITEPTDFILNRPVCNNKATIEITRLAGTSSAEIVIEEDGVVIKTETIASGESSKKFNLNNLKTTGTGYFRMTIRNIQTGQFLRARIGAWYN